MKLIDDYIKNAKKKHAKFWSRIDFNKFKTMIPNRECVYKEGFPVYRRNVHIAGELLSYRIIDDDMTAVLFMDRTFTVKHEVISTKVFKNFLETKGRGRFFDIEYEMFGFMDEIEIASCTYNTVKEDAPFWYENQRFRELIEMVYEKDPKEKAEALAVAEAHEKNTAHLDEHF